MGGKRNILFCSLRASQRSGNNNLHEASGFPLPVVKGPCIVEHHGLCSPFLCWRPAEGGHNLKCGRRQVAMTVTGGSGGEIGKGFLLRRKVTILWTLCVLFSPWGFQGPWVFHEGGP